jgi:hypothetical protein
MRAACLVFLLALSALCAACDRREDPENAPTPQPRGETTSPPTDPEQPTAPVEGDAKDKGTPADPDSGT